MSLIDDDPYVAFERKRRRRRTVGVIAAAAAVAGALALAVLATGDGGDNGGDSEVLTGLEDGAGGPSTTTARRPTTTEPATTEPATTEPATTATSGAVPGAPQIVSFVGPASVACTAATEVELSWSTANAFQTWISIDSRTEVALGPFAPTATERVFFACDEQAHRYLLTADAPDGSVAELEIIVSQQA